MPIITVQDRDDSTTVSYTVPPSGPLSAVWGVYHGMNGSWDVGDNEFIAGAGAVPKVGISYYSLYDGEGPHAQWSPQDHARITRGTVPQISMESKSYKNKPNVWLWRDIAAGVYDAQIRAFATKVASLDALALVCLDHEADEYYRNGYRPGETPAEFRAAWRHAKSIMSPLAPKARFVWWAGGSASAVKDFYPGNDVVDVVGVDAYKWRHNINPSATPLQTWKPYWDRAEAAGIDPKIPRAMTETGTDIGSHGVAEAVKWWSAVADTANQMGLRYVNFWSRASDGDWAAFAPNGSPKPGYEPVCEEIKRQIAKMSGTLDLNRY